MACSTCSSKDGSVAGCQNNGGCSTGGCNKMNVFDWLSNMDLPAIDIFDVVEVRFKGGNKQFFRNTKDLDLTTGDAVVVDVPNGHHIGYVSLQGELVRLQMQKKKVPNDDNLRKIYRIATTQDLDSLESVKKREMPTLYRTRQIIQDLRLSMKLSDVEYQADGNKATFYYSADSRVDFRELIKMLAAEFRVRIEMRQISLREEAGRLGGIGSCGRELCCSTWLSNFRSVSTSAARYQKLSLNPSKLSGQCGRLKCCLNYELDTYLDALKDIPDIRRPLITKKGEAFLQKTDIFRKTMWFAYRGENNWIPVAAERVREVIRLNKQGEHPSSLLKNQVEAKLDISVLNNDLVKMDQKFERKNQHPGGKKRRKKKKSNRPRNDS